MSLQDYLFHFAAEVGRGDAGFAFEGVRKIGFLVEAQGIADFGNGLVGGYQQIFGGSEFPHLN